MSKLVDKCKNKYYITTPLYYVNDYPHIGHSYTNVAADAMARYKRLCGNDVFFLTGTDEHGQKVHQASDKEGKTPKEFVDKVVKRFVKLWEVLSISYDKFIRTTDTEHIASVQKILQVLFEKGDIYEDEYRGGYCTPCETFWTKTQVTKQKCPDCQRDLEDISEKNYFFKLSKYQQWLIDYIENNDDFIKPTVRRNEILSFLNEPLEDLCISRPIKRLRWGIKVPFSSEYVTYVWFDALTNYISALGYAAGSDMLKKYWPADLHIIGKDILRQHTVYWPIMLRALGLDNPIRVFAHGWWTKGNQKMSKSRGNIVDPFVIVEKYGVDAYRYFLLREVSFGLDGVFTEEALINRLNSDLANDIGNLLNRTLTMVEKYFEGNVPVNYKNTETQDKDLIDTSLELAENIDTSMNNIDFSGALSSIWVLINKANKYIENSAPWILSKNKNTKRLSQVIYNLMEVLRIVTIAISPFMPVTSEKMWAQLGIKQKLNTLNIYDIKEWGKFIAGTKVNKKEPIFPRIQLKS